MHRALVSTARLCLAAAAAGRGRSTSPLAAAAASQAFRRAALRPRSLAAAALRRYHNVSAIATPFPGLQPALPDKATAPAQRWAPAAPSLGSRLSGLWQLYLASLARRPLITKAATSFMCVVIGDSIAQAIGGSPYSVVRVLRLAAYSATVGASCGHFWHRWLEQTIHPEAPQCHAAVVKKTALDQLVLSPVMCAVFFTALKLMDGNPAGILPFLQEKWLPTVCTSMAVWGPYNLASFRFIPENLRVLCGNCAGILWGCYMSVSCINQAPSAGCAAAAALQASQVAE